MRPMIVFRQSAFVLLLAIAAFATSSCQTVRDGENLVVSHPSAGDEYVSVSNGQFIRGGSPYRFVGVNMWYGAWLAADTGNIDRLRAELDLLQSIGVRNLRVLAASERSPLPNSIRPAFQDRNGKYNESLLLGLDMLLAEMAERDMTAVLYLANFWEWSGGMTTYMHWDEGRELVEIGNPEVDFWPAYPRLAGKFYSSEAANRRYRRYISMLLARRNSVTGQLYSDDPTIMAWQLANEPRPGANDEMGEANVPAFVSWVEDTAAFIKMHAPDQLVSIGNEGVMGCLESRDCYVGSGSLDHVDYLTVHLWPKNWSWIDADDMAGTLARAVNRSRSYVAEHQAMARSMNKPLVLEEFGLPRDNEAIAPGSSTIARDLFLRAMYGVLEQDSSSCGVLAGSNLWAWGGFGRAARDTGVWEDGDSGFLGDPPQEPQGLNSVFASDLTTIEVMRSHADTLTRNSDRCTTTN